MRTILKDKISRAIEQKIFPGCVIGVVAKSGQRMIMPFGHFTYESDSNAIKEDSIFDVASITKSIPTSSIVLKLIGEGKISIEDKLIDYVPEFNNSDRESVLIKHLLTYTLDYNRQLRLSDFKDKSPDEILQVIFNTEFISKPGKEFLYTNATAILMGLVAERAGGKKLDDMADTYFFKPLRMDHTSFHPDTFNKQEIVPTEFDDWRGRLIQGEVHDESAFTLRKKMVVGSAGLFSTVPDLLTFMEMVLSKGKYEGKEYIKEEMINLIYTNQLESIGKSAGLGWELNQPHYMGKYVTPNTFGKTGFTGCVVVGDMKKKAAVVILSNYTFPKRKENGDLINEIRRYIMDAVFQGL